MRQKYQIHGPVIGRANCTSSLSDWAIIDRWPNLQCPEVEGANCKLEKSSG